MKPIFLIGYMGSGKSTLGKALGERSGLRFIDLDEYIESRAGASIADIFADRGEVFFRELEREALSEVASFDNVIVACGGGTPCRPGAMELMNRQGLTVFLNASFPRLLVRLKEGRSARPLISNLNDSELERFIEDSIKGRMPYYSQAAMTFDSDRLEDEKQIDESCGRFIILLDSAGWRLP